MVGVGIVVGVAAVFPHHDGDQPRRAADVVQVAGGAAREVLLVVAEVVAAVDLAAVLLRDAADAVVVAAVGVIQLVAVLGHRSGLSEGRVGDSLAQQGNDGSRVGDRGNGVRMHGLVGVGTHVGLGIDVTNITVVDRLGGLAHHRGRG